MKLFKCIFLILIFSASIFSGLQIDQKLKVALLFGMKESPDKIIQNEDRINAKDKNFLYSLKEKKDPPQKLKMNTCLKSSSGSVSGYVFSLSGVPLEGVELYLLPKGFYEPNMELGIRYLYNYYGITDSSGFYSLFFEEEGDYVLLAYDPEGFYIYQYYNGKNSYEEADVLNLKNGDNLTGLNFYLNKAGTISGRVYDTSTGEGIWGIYIYTINSSGAFEYGTQYFINSLTDEEGNYKLTGLLPGTYEIYAIDYGNFYGESTYPGQITIFGSEDITGIDFGLNPSSTGIKGKIFLPSGEAASGAWVDATNYIDPWSFSYYFTFTNSKGEYRIGAQEGSYIIGAGTYDFSTLPTYYPQVRNAWDATPVNVEEGKIIEDINIKLLAAGFIEGQVLSVSGNPLSSIFVEVFDSSGFPVSSGVTDGEGKFSIGGLDEGNYLLFAWDWEGNYAAQWYNGKHKFEEADPIFVKGGETTQGIIFRLNTSGKIKGKVLDSQTQTPISDIMLVAYNENFFYESYALSDVFGNFELNGLSTDSYIIFGYDMAGIYIPTYFDQVLSLEEATPVYVLEGEEVNITFKMLKGGTIKGYVKNTNYLPISYALITAFDLNGNWAGFGYGNEDGSYLIGGLSGGTYLLLAIDGFGEYAPKWYPNADEPQNSTPVNIGMGETKEGINFYLPPAGSISGNVKDLQGSPLPYMYLFAEKIGGNTFYFMDSQWGSTDGNGNYIIKGLGTGNYRVGLILSNGMIYYYNGTFDINEATPVSVTQGQETKNINFQVNPGSGGITGKVTDNGTGEPVVFAYVTVFDEFGIPVSFGFTDDMGNYFAYFINKGKYKVSAWADCYEEEWYREKTSFDEATWVWVSENGYVGGIDFTLNKLNCIK